MVQGLNAAIKDEAGLWSLASAKHLSGVVAVPN
jgi:phage tail sheath protein FI